MGASRGAAITVLIQPNRVLLIFRAVFGMRCRRLVEVGENARILFTAKQIVFCAAGHKWFWQDAMNAFIAIDHLSDSKVGGE